MKLCAVARVVAGEYLPNCSFSPAPLGSALGTIGYLLFAVIQPVTIRYWLLIAYSNKSTMA